MNTSMSMGFKKFASAFASRSKRRWDIFRLLVYSVQKGWQHSKVHLNKFGLSLVFMRCIIRWCSKHERLSRRCSLYPWTGCSNPFCFFIVLEISLASLDAVLTKFSNFIGKFCIRILKSFPIFIKQQISIFLGPHLNDSKLWLRLKSSLASL